MKSIAASLAVVALTLPAALSHPGSGLVFLGSKVKRDSPDESCGGTAGYTCGATNVGPCCSQYGWCGATDAYCGAGCQSAFGTCSTPTTTSTATQPTSTWDVMECGVNKGGQLCPTGYCCSQAGWCGTTDPYCGDGCQPNYSNGLSCTNGNTGGTACGALSGLSCPTGQCCGPSGFCGTSSSFCASPACQDDYGTCDSDMTPAGATTSNIPRPDIGDVPFGVQILDCIQPAQIAFTYDDGPMAYTSDLIDMLDAAGAKATFMITGNNNGKGMIDDETKPWPAVIRKMHASGHQIASHTWAHLNLSQVTESVRRDEMIKNEMALRNILGFIPTYMRPPYDDCDTACMATMKDLGYHVIIYDLDTEDYLHDSADEIQISKDIITNTLNQYDAANGDDFLSIMHDIHYQTVYNLTSFFLTTLTAKGYTAVTVGECLGDAPANWYRDASGTLPSSSVSVSSVASTSTSSSSTSSSVAPSTSSSSATSSSSTRTSSSSTRTSSSTRSSSSSSRRTTSSSSTRRTSSSSSRRTTTTRR